MHSDPASQKTGDATAVPLNTSPPRKQQLYLSLNSTKRQSWTSTPITLAAPPVAVRSSPWASHTVHATVPPTHPLPFARCS